MATARNATDGAASPGPSGGRREAPTLQTLAMQWKQFTPRLSSWQLASPGRGASKPPQKPAVERD
eukprot:5980268-Pleurochrysis_carterae.AAC.2